eukprot:3329687-Pleurochrysis_carterae.AAC.4
MLGWLCRCADHDHPAAHRRDLHLRHAPPHVRLPLLRKRTFVHPIIELAKLLESGATKAKDLAVAPPCAD